MSTAIEAEERLVTCAFADPTIRQRVQVTPEQFQSLPLRAVWTAMGDHAGFDELAVADRMDQNVLEKSGGLAWLAKLALGAGTTSNVDYYADRVRDAYLKREVQAKASEILHADSGESGADLLSSLANASDSLSRNLSRTRRTLADVVSKEQAVASSPSEGPNGVPMGTWLDRWVPGGAPRKKVMTIFADTGSFKTTFVSQCMFDMAGMGARGLNFSLEDPDELLAHRWLSRTAGVPYGHIAGGVLSDAERQLIESVAPGQWESLKNIVTVDDIEPNIDHIVREVAAEKARGGLDWVVVDYLQLLSGRGDPASVLTEAMKKAAIAAKRYDVAWIYISQQNDRNDMRKDPRPCLKDMFGSAAMRQMSKTVFALFRPSEHWEDPRGSNKHPLYGMYSRMFDRNESLMEKVYPNVVELWMLKNILGRKKAVQGLIAKPEVGILDQIDLRTVA